MVGIWYKNTVRYLQQGSLIRDVTDEVKDSTEGRSSPESSEKAGNVGFNKSRAEFRARKTSSRSFRREEIWDCWADKSSRLPNKVIWVSANSVLASSSSLRTSDNCALETPSRRSASARLTRRTAAETLCSGRDFGIVKNRWVRKADLQNKRTNQFCSKCHRDSTAGVGKDWNRSKCSLAILDKIICNSLFISIPLGTNYFWR